MQTIYNSAGIPFYQGYAAPESLFDDLYNQIKNGSFYVDILNKNIYTMSNSAWVAVTDNTTLSSLVPTTDIIQTVETNVINGLYLFQTRISTYYTTDRTGVLSVYLPAVQGNTGRWVAVEDSLGYGINIMSDPAQHFRVINRLGGITGVVSKHYLFCDGVKWQLAKSFTPSGNVASNIITVDVTNGNDISARRGTNKAFKTIAMALSVSLSGDVINVLPGVYDECNLTPVNGVTVYLYEGVVIQPTFNGGAVPVFIDTAVYGNSTDIRRNTIFDFKILGRGKILSRYSDSSWSHYKTITIAMYKATWTIECDTLTSINIIGEAVVTINNTKITHSTSNWLVNQGANVLSNPTFNFNNCKFINASPESGINLGTLANRYNKYNNCDFIRTVDVAPHDTMVNGAALAPFLGLNTIRWVFTGVGHDFGSLSEFVNCRFYNFIGGDNIYAAEPASASAYIIMRDCTFYNSNSDLTRGTGKAFTVTTGGGQTIKLYLINNTSDTTLNILNSATTTNLFGGSGFPIPLNLGGNYSKKIGITSW